MAENLETLWEEAKPEKTTTVMTGQEDVDSLWEKAAPHKVESMPFTAEDLKGATNVSELPKVSGQTIGGIALPLAATIAAPSTGGLSLIGLAAVGGAGGEAWEQVYNIFAEPEKEQKTTSEAAGAILRAGGEEAVYELGGQVATKVVGKAYHIVKPKMLAGVDELQKTLQKYGGSFTAAERTDSFLTQTVDGLTRGSLTGKGIMKNADDINEAALKLWERDLSNKIASSASRNMTDEQFGEFVKTTLSDGRTAFRAKMGELYSSFDDIVMTRIEKEMVERTVKSPILDKSGKEISSKVISQVSREIRPVDIRPLKAEARELAERLSRVSNIGKGDFGGRTIDDILNLDDAVRFSDAHTLKSTLSDIGLAIKNNPMERKLYGSISNFASKVSKAMDNAALNQGDDAFIAYKKITKEAKKGYSVFNDKLIAKMLSDETSSVKIGEMIYKDGNVDQVRMLKKALNRAAKYDKSINVNKVWEQTQQKYIESVFNSITKDVETEAGETLVEFQARSGGVGADKLLRRLQNPKQVRTMNEMLSSEHRQLIFDFAHAAGITQQKSVAGLSMLIQLTQAGAVVGTLTGKAGAAQTAATILLPTTFLAKMMSNPVTARLMVSAAKTNPAAKEAPKLIAKVMIAYENAKAEEEGRDKPIDKLIDYSEDKLKAL